MDHAQGVDDVGILGQGLLGGQGQAQGLAQVGLLVLDHDPGQVVGRGREVGADLEHLLVLLLGQVALAALLVDRAQAHVGLQLVRAAGEQLVVLAHRLVGLVQPLVDLRAQGVGRGHLRLQFLHLAGEPQGLVVLLLGHEHGGEQHQVAGAVRRGLDLVAHQLEDLLLLLALLLLDAGHVHQGRGVARLQFEHLLEGGQGLVRLLLAEVGEAETADHLHVVRHLGAHVFENLDRVVILLGHEHAAGEQQRRREVARLQLQGDGRFLLGVLELLRAQVEEGQGGVVLGVARVVLDRLADAGQGQLVFTQP